MAVLLTNVWAKHGAKRAGLSDVKVCSALLRPAPCSTGSRMLLLCPTQRRAKGWLEKSAGEEFAGEEFAGEAGAERSLHRSPGVGRMLGRELHPSLFCQEKIAHLGERNLLVVACRDGKALQMLDKYPTSKSPAVPGSARDEPRGTSNAEVGVSSGAGQLRAWVGANCWRWPRKPQREQLGIC